MSDPYNTRQKSSNGNPLRRIKDSICITDPEHLLKKNVGEKSSYEQRKENQSKKQYSLRSKTKEEKEESDIGSSEIPSMSSRKPSSIMETNDISVCIKSVSPELAAKQIITIIITIIITVLTSWEVVGVKQITNRATSVITRVPNRTNVVIVVTGITWVKTFTTEIINNMGKGWQIFSISSKQQQFQRCT